MNLLPLPVRNIYLLLLPAILLLQSCPHHLVQELEEQLPPADYRPVYLVSSLSAGNIDSVLSEFRQDSLYAVPAPGSMPEEAGKAGGAQTRRAINIELRSIDDRAYPEQVELRAVVYDYRNRYITGLAPPYFSGSGSYKQYWRNLVDSCTGTEHAVRDFEVVEIRQNAAEPHAFAYVLDYSGSMGRKRREALQDAAIKMVRVLKKQDWVSVIKFGSKTYTSIPMANRPDSVQARLTRDDREHHGDGTVLYDAALAGIAQLDSAPAGHKKTIILFSDGQDTESEASIDSLLRSARAKNVTIYTIAIGLGFNAREPMERMADYTNGRFYQVYSRKEFPYVFADIYLTLQNYYRIRYTPPDCPGRHRVDVPLFIKGAPQENLKASGYYDRSIFTPLDPVGTTVLLNIEFASGSAEIEASSRPMLNDVVTAMRRNPQMRIRVLGHTDDVGDEEANLQLSRERARSVKNALLRSGIAAGRVETEGYGESVPLVENSSAENRRKNRRTEFVILEQ